MCETWVSVCSGSTCLHRSHEFVVKGGEDLRLDERIQQLWRVLCGLAARHPAAAARGLGQALTTFDVLPMTPHLGMMAFVKVGVSSLANVCAKDGCGMAPMDDGSC